MSIPSSMMLLAAIVIVGAASGIYLMRRPAYRRFAKAMWLPIGMITTGYWVLLVCAHVNPEQRAWLWIVSGVLGTLGVFSYRLWRSLRSTPGYRPLPATHRALLYLVTFAYLVPFALVVGGELGRSTGDAMRARLELVWPNLMSMPVDDRAAIVRLAVRCNVTSVPLDQKAVVGCLGTSGGDGEDVARLAVLLKQREERQLL